MSDIEGDEENRIIQVDIEQIMRKIRLEILDSQETLQNIPGISTAFQGSRFQPDLYDHLYQAGLYSYVADIPLDVTSSPAPIVGYFWRFGRRIWHKMVLNYVTILAAKQSLINQELLTAVVQLINELEAKRMKD